MVGSKCRDFKNREVSNVNTPSRARITMTTGKSAHETYWLLWCNTCQLVEKAHTYSGWSCCNNPENPANILILGTQAAQTLLINTVWWEHLSAPHLRLPFLNFKMARIQKWKLSRSYLYVELSSKNNTRNFSWNLVGRGGFVAVTGSTR